MNHNSCSAAHLFSSLLSSPLLSSPLCTTNTFAGKEIVTVTAVAFCLYPSVRQPPPENDRRGTLIYDINWAVLRFRHPRHDV
jgi:hypothetical protein